MVGAEGADPTTPAVGDEIRPYKIHVSSKYLDLTRQKLELTRLPHEVSEPRSLDWWEPKAQVEPLIDFWLEKYSWRDHENSLNNLPQFRTLITPPGSQAPLRTHFVHARSPHADAIPLLLLPPFPFTNLSFGHLVKPLTEPDDPASQQPFHLVIPALPGLGFSEPLPNNTPAISVTAEILNALMSQLSYPHYLATNVGAGSSSPEDIDWRLAHCLATRYAGSCVGTNLISPPLASPKPQEALWEWAKWSIASFFRAGILGYSQHDFSAGQGNSQTGLRSLLGGCLGRQKKVPATAPVGLNNLSLREPNTLAYGICDSPTGLLVFILKGLRLLGPKTRFTPEAIINLTQLAWLPGPEYAMRFWAHCALHGEDRGGEKGAKAAARPRVALTVFLGGNTAEVQNEGVGGEREKEAGDGTGIPGTAPQNGSYVPPAWGNAHYDIVHAQRCRGAPGLLAWERPEIIATGVRGLAEAILKLDDRLRPNPTAEIPATAPLERIVVVQGEDQRTPAGEAEQEQHEQGPPEEKKEKKDEAASTSKQALPAVGSSVQVSERATASSRDLPVIEEAQDEGHLQVPRIERMASDGESPDTLVERTPPPVVP